MPELSDVELDALVEEATVDAYGDDEQLGGFAVMIEDNLEVPCPSRRREAHSGSPPTATGQVACEGVPGQGYGLVPGRTCCGYAMPILRLDVMPANRMNRDEFYAAMAPHDDTRLRKVLWTVYWRGNAQLRERIEEQLRPQDQPEVKPKKERPDPIEVLAEVTAFVELAKGGAYMAGDRRVHHTQRSKWRHTFRRLAADALAALTASEPAPARQAVAKIVDLACEMKRYDYFHSAAPVEAAKFVVSEAVAALWESVLRHDGFVVFAACVPEQLIRWEADYGWTRRGYGQVAERETPLAVPLARLLATPDMWRTFTESYLRALEEAGRADPKRPRTMYGTFDETSYLRKARTDDLAAWHDMLLDRFAGTPEDNLLDRLVASPALTGPELIFLRARIAQRRGDVPQAATLVTKCLKEMPGRQAYLDFAVEVGAELPSRAREIAAERARVAKYSRTT